ncbi:MAG: hypothetical protein KJO50_06430 [Bacteroidia bacterium]|nr:hypothetical protein [Bacteroidia bacterium]
MKFYFKLEFRRIKRRLMAFGINPWLGLLLIAIVFVALSEYLFFKTELAEWVYCIICMSLMSGFSESGRINNLKQIFSVSDYWKIRLIENCMLACPFIIYLLCKNSHSAALLLIPASFIMVFVSLIPGVKMVLPTPFAKIPWEFPSGFRKTILLILLAMFLFVKAIQVENFNLSLFSIGFVFVVFMSYYFKAEPIEYYSIYTMNSKAFLLKKISFALYCSGLLTLPMQLIVAVFFPDNILIQAFLQFGAWVFLISIILAKYSAFPNEMHFPQVILLALSLWFPPAIFFTVPIFWIKARNNLNEIPG